MGVNNPPKHQHVRYKSYPNNPATAWDIVNKYSHLTDASNFSLYGKREPSGRMNFSKYGYTSIQKIYDQYLFNLKESFGGDSLFTIARDSIANFLKNKWKGPEKFRTEKFEGGLNNIIAQSRIASSYGLMQMWYVTATERGYGISENKAPEKLNEIETFFTFASNFHLENLKAINGSNSLEANVWNESYEKIWQSVFSRWNPWMSNYEQDIAVFSLKFKPQ